MCQSKSEGGKRCDACRHAPAFRRTMRAAARLYGKNSVENRQKVEALPPEFVCGSIAERAAFVETTADPEVLALARKDKPAVRAALLRNSHLAPEVLAESATAGYKNSTFDVIGNPSTPAETLETLTETGTPAVRLEAAKALMNRGESLDAFTKHPSSEIRVMVAGHTKSLEVRDSLLNDVSAGVRERAVKNSNLVGAPLPLCVASDRSTRVRVAAAKTTGDPAALAALAQDHDRDVSSAARKNSACPEVPRAKVTVAPLRPGTDVDELAENRWATTGDLASAYADYRTTPEQRLALALSPAATETMKRNHLDDPKFDAKRRALFAIQAEDAKSLVILAQDRSSTVREFVAQNPATPRDVLKHLAASSLPDVSAYAEETLRML
jgi:hypothetical protein